MKTSLGAKLTIWQSSNTNERKLINEIQTIDFDDIIINPQNLTCKKKCIVLRHLKVYSKYVMASRSSRATQRDPIFNMINFMGTLSLFFTLNLVFIHHILLAV